MAFAFEEGVRLHGEKEIKIAGRAAACASVAFPGETDAGAVCGVAPAGQPMAGAMFTVGSSVGFAGGNCGLGPVPSDTDSVAMSPQAPRPSKTRSK